MRPESKKSWYDHIKNLSYGICEALEPVYRSQLQPNFKLYINIQVQISDIVNSTVHFADLAKVRS